MVMKRIVCTVTNDLNYDQRMIRICSSLSNAGYHVTLIGRKRANSKPLQERTFSQKRLPCFFDSGKMFYIEYNLRLFLALLFVRCDVLCAIDLDTILPVLFASRLRNKKRVYDAHELFCEMEEIVRRPRIYKVWKAIERYAVPKFQTGYTIGTCYAEEFRRMYGVQYGIVRNATILQPLQASTPGERYILYQGAVNHGRAFETLIPAMRSVDAKLIICGEGNFFEEANALVDRFQLHEKILFKGYVPPEQLRSYTRDAYIGITLFTNEGKSNYLSLANRFFDYMHAGVPQLAMDYPEYRLVNTEFEIATLLPDTAEQTIARALNDLLQDTAKHARLKANCNRAREVYCWQQQEITLINTYKQLLG